MYLEGVGIRSIERPEDISNRLVIYRIRHFAELIRKEIRRRQVPEKQKDIAIAEVDELFT